MSNPISMPQNERASLASTSVEKFHTVLKSSTRIFTLCGAGLSVASGLDTFRGAGGIWRSYRSTALATPEAFERDPGLVRLFYAYRRHKALQAKPNIGHHALAELTKSLGEKAFICLTQNIDGLSQRANHPREQLKLLHSSLFDIKCASCPYYEPDNFNDPVHPSLLVDEDSVTARLSAAAKSTPKDNSTSPDGASNSPTIPLVDLPHCPSCKTGLLRPAVVWFGEALPEDTLDEIDQWIDKEPIDLCLVIGTTATVYPAASYVHVAQAAGARVAVINMDSKDLGSTGTLRKKDFLFEGDAARILPDILRPVVGGLEAFAGLGKTMEGRKETTGNSNLQEGFEDEDEEMNEVQK
ncbi:NAD-dependent protein deacylase [Lachnellula suecica]|uniref:NAD-dependent protein deacylase n=1 Tax=Lachnellula suecica TaxID=602035 RepID=A0A8T9BYB9_9HELO|nr:NAD-dependent protein deacylase [Lachnellula suecica]